ncbi:MAG: MopE-related protein, partial [Myxococcota bacterium]
YGGDDCDDSDGSVYPGDGVTPAGPDLDCDGHVSVTAGGDDCDDGDPAVYPGAEDSWYDGIDSDCGGEDDYDRDGDGHRAGAWADDVSVADCDDSDAAVHPSVVADDCGGGDEDCDGELDEDCRPSHDTGDGAVSDGDTDFDMDSDSDADGDSDEDADADVDHDFDGGSDTGVGDSDDPDSGDGSGVEDDTGMSGSGSGDDTGEPGDGAEDPNADWEAPAPGSVTTPGSSEKREGCGCNLAPRPPSWVWMGPLLLLVGWRRRSPEGNA